MDKNGLIFSENISEEEFCHLRESVGFQKISKKQAQKILENTQIVINAVYDGHSIGLVRILTDFVTDAYITDVIVSPDYQGHGIGERLIKQAIDCLKEQASDGVTIACSLYANPGKEEFYEKYGFRKLPNGKYGYGMLVEI